jgi:hypothetical protein
MRIQQNPKFGGGGVIARSSKRYTLIVKTSITREGEKHTDE